MLLLPVVCVVVRSAKQFRLQCTFDSHDYGRLHLRKSTRTVDDNIHCQTTSRSDSPGLVKFKQPVTQRHYESDCFSRCMECQRGLAMRKVSVCPSVCLSVRPSVRLSNAWIVTKRKENLSRFLYLATDHVAWFSEKKSSLLVGRPLLPEILGQPAPVGAKSRISKRYSRVAF